MGKFSFNGTILEDVLRNYLDRAVTAAGLTDSTTLDDDIRTLQNIGAKFLGRSACVWSLDEDNETHFQKAAELAQRVHKMDEEIILQASIFEAIYPEVAKIPIPSWVFEAFHLEVENRYFCYEDMLFAENPPGFIWDGSGGIPDLNQLETQLWFYYRAGRYIAAGYEALHMGQIHLYTANDYGFVKTSALFEKIRAYGKEHGRRHLVLLDAHSHGININGKLLLDYHAMPYSRMPILDKPGEKLAFVMEGYSESGESVHGYYADPAPYLMEYDNWGGKFFDDSDNIPYEKRAYMEWWGYDQITWFANQDEESRNQYLEYTYKWTIINNPNACFEIPFRRGIGAIPAEEKNMINSTLRECYQANMKSTACPHGFSQEETIKRLWESDIRELRALANPTHIENFGAKDCFDNETGIKLPERVIVYGTFQHHVGAINNDSNSETTRMYYVGDNTYKLSIVLPFKGEYDFAISVMGILSQTYSIDRYPRSGSSTKKKFSVPTDNAVVQFTYQFGTNVTEVTVLS